MSGEAESAMKRVNELVKEGVLSEKQADAIRQQLYLRIAEGVIGGVVDGFGSI
jgi:hypothetical protein